LSRRRFQLGFGPDVAVESPTAGLIRISAPRISAAVRHHRGVFRLAFAPLYVAAAAVLLVTLAAIFIRLADGRYAEALLKRAATIRALRRFVIRSYIRELERTNPLAARARPRPETDQGRTRRCTNQPLIASGPLRI
jgi:hypothetical protein